MPQPPSACQAPAPDLGPRAQSTRQALWQPLAADSAALLHDQSCEGADFALRQAFRGKV